MYSPLLENEKYETFLLRYRFEGQEWGFEIKAKDLAEAKARLTQLPFARLDGKLIARIPFAAGPLALLATYIRNGLRRIFAP